MNYANKIPEFYQHMYLLKNYLNMINVVKFGSHMYKEC